MIVHGHTHDDLTAMIGPLISSWSEEIVPHKVEVLPSCCYAPAYGWMFTYEKRLKYRIEKVLRRPLGSLERKLFGPDSAISEGLSNAFVHGHRRNSRLALKLQCSVGKKGLALSICDSGEGFDVAKVVDRAQRGSTYYSYAGNGMKTLVEHPEVTASYGDGGRSLHLAIEWSHH